MKINVIELFSGIGAPRKALANLNLNHNLLFISEIDKSAEIGYRAIFNDYKTLNLGDIKDIYSKKIISFENKCDLLIFGSPCQDFSQGGNNKSGEKNSGTRSSLLWEAFRIINTIKPKIVLFENVKNLIHKKHAKILNNYLNEMQDIGYFNNKPILLNSNDFGIPQNRERIFVVSSLEKNIIEKIKKTDWNLLKEKRNSLECFLTESDFNKRKLIDKKIEFKDKFTNFATWTDNKGNINGSYNRAWKIQKYCGTLSYCNVIKITDGYNVSKINGIEGFRLMGFDDKDYFNVYNKGIKENKILSLAGNSIVVKVLEKIFKVIYE